MTSYISRNTRGVPPAEEVPIVDGQPVAPAGEFTRRAKATRLNICQGRKTTSVPSTQTTLPIPHSFSSPGGTPIPHGIGAEIQDNIEMAMRNDR
jgi:hypothetical protein